MGCFALAGFLAGTWCVNATLREGGEPVFPDVVVPRGAPDPFPITLVLEGGEVHGTLSDARTGLPFDEAGPRWWVFLSDALSGARVGELQGGHVGESFRLVGVAAGELRLTVLAHGHAQYIVPSLFLAEGQVLDVGDLALEPCGILDLTVRDASGRPTAFRATFDTSAATWWSSDPEKVETGHAVYSWLPPGAVTLTVGASDHLDQVFELDLAPGSSHALEVRLRSSSDG